ncbi:hypothetical protein C8R43DRAFT_941691 [Mycena crocata]|nr:hypothetical protein C8R43DRAFT_941691 [Mycena crocata]
MAKYFNPVHNFKSEFNVVFTPRDRLQVKFTTKHRVLDMYDDLMDRVNGNILRTAENNEFQNGFSMLQASGFMWKFVFFIPPGHVLHEDIHQEFRKAMYGFFDGTGEWSGEGENLWDVPLCVKNDVPVWKRKRWDVPNVGEIRWDVPLGVEIWWDIPGCVQIAWDIPMRGMAADLGVIYSSRFGSE